MAKSKKNVIVAKGLIWGVVNGKRVGFESLDEAMDFMSQCCGIDCCNNVIRLRDKVTGVVQEISVSNGELQINGTNVVPEEESEEEEIEIEE